MSSQSTEWARWLGAALLVGCSTTASNGAGTPDAASACTLASDCPTGQHCSADGRCTFECREDRDCLGRGRCEMSVGRCIPADAGPAKPADVPRIPDDRPPPTPDVADAAAPPPEDVPAPADVPSIDPPDAAADVTDVAATPDVVDVVAPPPDAGCGPEVCNGVDDDCNGVADDLPSAACTVGPCASGVRRCPPALPPGVRFVESASPTCAPDSFAPSTSVCRPPAGECDVAERCTGSDAQCPPDGFAPGDQVCHASATIEACDPAERCTGSGAACPADRVTRAPGAETCNNLDDDCDGRVDDDATCPSGQSCVAGVCTAVSPDGVVDPDTVATGITLLRDPRDGTLVVVYTDDGRNEVRTARFNGRWALATVFRDRRIEKQGADLDASGAVHAVFTETSPTTLYYANDRGGAWSTPAVVPGMAGTGATMDLDAAGVAHVTSTAPLAVRRYTTNAGGAWLGTPAVVSSSGTAPAAIVAPDGAPPAMAHAVWNARRIDFGEAPGWGPSTLSGYGVDQGPPMSIVARSGALAVAYVLTTDVYTNYSVFFQQRPAGGGWSSRAEIVGGLRGIGPVELALDESGTRFVAFCAGAGEMRAATDRGGAWRVSLLPMTAPCSSAMDALVVGGRLVAAFRSTGGQLRVASFETAGL